MANAADIRAAAERLGSLFAGTMEGESGIQVTSQRMCDYVTLARAYLNGPRWHDTPPSPGLYVSLNPDGSMSGLLWHVVVTDPAEYRRYCPGRRWFGPLPERETTP